MTTYSAWLNRVLVFLLLCAIPNGSSAQQLRYFTGQNVAPMFEGWQRNPDGTATMVFGYLNRNYEEEIDVPIGTDNNIEPDGDRGQPTHFYTRRQRFVFKVVVPKNWGKRDVVWTVTSHGKTDKAYGSLAPDWEINDGIIAQNRGFLGTPTYLGVPNQPPSITGSDQTVTFPNPVTVTASVTDDGIPKPRPPAPRKAKAAPFQIRGRRPEGLSVTWIHYRGLGKVTFDPDTPEKVIDGKASTQVSFSTPGTYVLRAIADDGALMSTADVKVTVLPVSPAQVPR